MNRVALLISVLLSSSVIAEETSTVISAYRRQAHCGKKIFFESNRDALINELNDPAPEEIRTEVKNQEIDEHGQLTFDICISYLPAIEVLNLRHLEQQGHFPRYSFPSISSCRVYGCESEKFNIVRPERCTRARLGLHDGRFTLQNQSTDLPYFVASSRREEREIMGEHIAMGVIDQIVILEESRQSTVSLGDRSFDRARYAQCLHEQIHDIHEDEEREFEWIERALYETQNPRVMDCLDCLYSQPESLDGDDYLNEAMGILGPAATTILQ